MISPRINAIYNKQQIGFQRISELLFYFYVKLKNNKPWEKKNHHTHLCVENNHCTPKIVCIHAPKKKRGYEEKEKCDKNNY